MPAKMNHVEEYTINLLKVQRGICKLSFSIAWAWEMIVISLTPVSLTFCSISTFLELRGLCVDAKKLY